MQSKALFSRIKPHKIAKPVETPTFQRVFAGAPETIRTSDHPLRRRVLYPLSYRRRYVAPNSAVYSIALNRRLVKPWKKAARAAYRPAQKLRSQKRRGSLGSPPPDRRLATALSNFLRYDWNCLLWGCENDAAVGSPNTFLPWLYYSTFDHICKYFLQYFFRNFSHIRQRLGRLSHIAPPRAKNASNRPFPFSPRGVRRDSRGGFPFRFATGCG